MGKAISIGIVTVQYGNRYFGSIINSILEVTKQNNVQTFIINTHMMYGPDNGSEDYSKYFLLGSKHIDAWIVLPRGANETHIRALINTGKPVILINTTIASDESDNYFCIMEDGFNGMAAAVEHLIGHGHKDIVFVGRLINSDMYDRFEGYKYALSKHGIPLNQELVYNTDIIDCIEGSNVVKRIINKKTPFTAFVAASDFLAIGIKAALIDEGFKVPEDVAVIGYDNSQIAINSGISSVQQEIGQIGKKAVQTLLDILSGQSLTNKTIKIKSSLSARESCGCGKEKNNSDSDWMGVLNYLEENILKNRMIGIKLMNGDISVIREVMSDLPYKCIRDCMGYWNYSSKGIESLHVKKIFDFEINETKLTDLYCDSASFPPDEFFPESYDLSANVVFLNPIRFKSNDWGVFCHISQISQYSYMSNVEPFINNLTYLSFALERELITKQQQFQIEKISSLGRLVSGVAHELNTPIGVAITASTFLTDNVNKALEIVNSGNVTKAHFKSILTDCLEASLLVLENIKKSSELISSFKSIATDVTLEHSELINFKSLLNTTVIPAVTLKNNHHLIEVHCDNNLEIRTYPDAIYQIITCLFDNSFLHAFDNGVTGTITISAKKENNKITINYADNGKGISQDKINKIFDPFFTTKRGSGRKGLGLNIVFNIATQILKGTITCKSEPGKETMFTIEIPETQV